MEINRLSEAKLLLTKTGCSHFLISDLTDVEYVSGFRSSNAAVIISKRRALILSDFRYKEAADLFCKKNPEWKFILVKEKFFSTIAQYIPEGSTLGYQSDYLTVDNFNDLKRSLKKVNLKSVSKEISGLYLQKNQYELDCMSEAAAIGDKALKKLLSAIKPGITEIELTRKLERYCCDLGSEKQSFDTIMLFGKRSALPHGKPQDIELKKGDWILIDFGCTVNGFCSDMTRTFVYGKASPLHKEIYSIVKEAQELGRKAARAGMSSKELDAVARSFIEKKGYGKNFGHALGHGVGLRIHERPRVSPHVDEVLKENCVVTIEPGIYIADFGGVRIEDTVILKKDGAPVITNFTRDLIEL